MIRRLRLGDLRRLLRDRCRGSTLPDDDAGRDYLRELLLPISIGPYEAVRRPGKIELWGPADRMRREIEPWAPWMQKDEAQALIDEINQMPMWQRKPKARTLGERLNVPYGERERLRLRTILPCDVTDEGMELLRKRKKRQRDMLRRQKKGQQSRADYLANSLTKIEPWKAEGKSRRTWYRQNGTSPRQVNLSQSSRQPVPPEKRLVSKEESAERNQSVSSTQTTTQSEKPEMSVTDTDRELKALTCAKTERTGNHLPPGVTADVVPTWVLKLPPDMAAMATVAWFYGSVPKMAVAA
jgi:hypothetical protein